MTRTRLTELLSALPVDVQCQHQDGEPFVDTIKYAESSLPPFEVPNASLFRCNSCKTILYSSGEARRWEINKAMKLVGKTSKLSSQEARFVRETTGVSASEVAAVLGLHKSTLSRWETKNLPRHGDRLIRAFFVLALLLADARAIAHPTMDYSSRFLREIAGSRVQLMKAALAGIQASDVFTDTELLSAVQAIEEVELNDARKQERTNVARIKEGDVDGYYYFANARYFSGEGVREFLQVAASRKAQRELHRFGRDLNDGETSEQS